MISFTVRSLPNYNELNWKTATEINVREFVVEFGFDATNFNQAGKLPSHLNQDGSSYSFNHQVGNDKMIYYRLKTVDNDNQYTYSKIITTVSKNKGEPVKLYPSVSDGRFIQVELNVAFRSLKVYNMYGQLIDREDPASRTGIISLNTTSWQKGTYILILGNDELQISKKFVVQ